MAISQRWNFLILHSFRPNMEKLKVLNWIRFKNYLANYLSSIQNWSKKTNLLLFHHLQINCKFVSYFTHFNESRPDFWLFRYQFRLCQSLYSLQFVYLFPYFLVLRSIFSLFLSISNELAKSGDPGYPLKLYLFLEVNFFATPVSFSDIGSTESDLLNSALDCEMETNC